MNETETTFAGVLFPTLLHAQWALFFEDLFIPWKFRVQPFALASGNQYEPDFWLPRHELWFQVGDDNRHDEDLMQWREFATAADGQPCEAEEDAAPGTVCEVHLSHAELMLPDEWRGRDVLYSAGGIPVAEDMTSSGPLSSEYCSMYTVSDSWYQWTSCPTCGFVGAEHAGRADRLTCGHGDRIRDKNARADDPQILAAYRLARQTIAAQFGGQCADCATPMSPGDLVGAGRLVGRRRWYHADCLLVSRRKRYQSHQLKAAEQSTTDSNGKLLAESMPQR